MKEAVFTTVPTLWGNRIPGPHPEFLPESYSTRHDGVLKVIVDFLQRHMAAGIQITADLPGQQYTFPQDIVPTGLHPDIVMWSTSAIYLMELTVPFETNIAGAAERKAHCYWELASACGRSHHMSIITLEVGSRGFLSIAGFEQLVPTSTS